ncbi:MAG TPA: class I tRNA ligase family protein, partial [Candidatus Glassbacteria bacterium]|nr:class I tRNA ligase family protein [Candidatus Glassbacteria bacterium]
AGKFVKNADGEISADLKRRGLLFHEEGYTHNYPFCWRCSTPLLYYARASWYVNTSRFRDELLANNSSVNWYPPEVGKGRFAEWLENNVDWALSRDRYWGTPLPIWTCESCSHQLCVGGVEELRGLGRDVPADIDLHKPYVDQISLVCPKCSARMKRVPEVIDCWFDSGAMPFAQLHYPFENVEEFEKNFPGNFICEAIDQTRGWFYSLLAISTLVRGCAPYRNVLVNDLILDKTGQKMSKSIGNVVNPWDIFNAYGADPLRWYLISVSQPWLPKRFDPNGVGEVVRKFFDTLLNVYSFFALYANIDEYAPLADPLAAVELEDELDRWVISRLNSAVKSVREDFSRYELTRVTRTLQQFVIEEVSNWYVRRNRRRFWQSGDTEDKRAAFATLWEVLVKVSRMIAPVAPFVSEEIYRNLVGLHLENEPESVHLSGFPQAEESRIDVELERKMDTAQKLVILGRAARNRSRIKVRQPLSLMLVQAPEKLTGDLLASVGQIIGEEINVKNIEPVENAYDYVTLSVKPDFKVAGPRFGASVKELASALSALPREQIIRLDRDGSVELALDGRKVTVRREEVELRTTDREGFVVETDGGYGVVLATALTEELVAEGIARELVNKIQNMRKSAGFEVLDRIEVGVESSARVDSAVEVFGDYIRRETLCQNLTAVLPDGANLKQEWDINGEPAVIAVKKAASKAKRKS